MRRNVVFLITAICIGLIAGISVFLIAYFYPKQYQKNEQGVYVNVAKESDASPFPVSSATDITIEYYYPEQKRTLTEKVDKIPALLGCDKEGVVSYLNTYMNHLSYEEESEGLISFELVAYKENSITLRKTFKKTEKTGYYAKSFNGTIVILKGDEKTVYEYTNIQIHLLPTELQQEIELGYYIENDEDLYNFLENYSS